VSEEEVCAQLFGNPCFPVAGSLAAIGDAGALINRHLVGDRAAPPAASVALPAGFPATQSAEQCSASALASTDSPIDAPMADTR